MKINDVLLEFAPGDGESGRWYTDDQMTDIVGDGWWQDLDISGEVSKQAMIQEAQAWLDDQGYDVQVLNVKVNDDDTDWFIQGSFDNPGFAKKGMPEDAEPMDREFALVKKLGRLGERVVQNPKLWGRYDQAIDNEDIDWIIGLIQDGTGATASEVTKLADLFGEIGGGLGRLTDFAWAVKEGTWDEDFMNPYRKYRSQGSEQQLDEILPALAAGAGALARGAAAAGQMAAPTLRKVPGAVKTVGQAIGRVPGAVEKVAIQGLELLNDKVPGGIFNPDGSLKGSQYLTKYLSPQEIQQAQQQQQQGMAEGNDDDYGPELDALKKEFGKFTTHYDRMEKDPAYAARYNKQQTDRQNRDMPNDAEDDFMSDRTHDMAEGKPNEKEADYGADYQDMVARVKKLAGMGPLKTVYDPQKRVYKNVPVAVQPKK